MIKKIRRDLFETNSSSTHSICIALEDKLEFPKEINFKFGEFGWKYTTFDSMEDKASYLYTGLYNNDRHEDIANIVKILESKDITITCEKVKKDSWAESGYIDHSDELTEFLNAICENEENLLSFLFSPLSFINSGNDNDIMDISINVDYNHLEFYKGN